MAARDLLGSGSYAAACALVPDCPLTGAEDPDNGATALQAVTAPTGWANTFGDGTVYLYKPQDGGDAYFGNIPEGDQAVRLDATDGITYNMDNWMCQTGSDVVLTVDLARAADNAVTQELLACQAECCCPHRDVGLLFDEGALVQEQVRVADLDSRVLWSELEGAV